jgi:hypothetical protein
MRSARPLLEQIELEVMATNRVIGKDLLKARDP